MNRIIVPMLASLFLGANVYAQSAFTLVSSEKRSVTLADQMAFEKSRTLGKKDGDRLTFAEKDLLLEVVTGPEDDMLSYRVQGVRNPILVVPAGATLTILFVNKDTDMRHDLRIGSEAAEFPIAPLLEGTVGSERLEPKPDDDRMQAEQIVIKANSDGAYKYFCSVRGHAKGGMWGRILVGIRPVDDVKTPGKTTHVRSPDEDKMDMPGMKMENEKTDVKKPAKPGEMADMPGMEHQHGEMPMPSTVNIGDPMSRESSGTAWVPDSSPMYAYSKMYEDGGMLMLMGSAFVRYTSIGSGRDVSVAGKGSRSRFDAPSMLMAMYSQPLTKRSQFGFRAMVSLDPLIQRGYGYPLLYQTGELFRGREIHDRQHPHDLVSELAVTYSYKVNERQSFFFYAGYPGEPALGPPTFMHRLSAMNNPDAPISHHWQDATHITWGVVTAGYSFGKFKFEASAFKGREPDENRWRFDAPKLDSFSGRFSWNPNKNWAFQISHGYLKDPEPAEPEVLFKRKTTASAIYNKRFDADRNWASSLVWGQNYANGERSNSFLFESDYDWGKNAVFGRLERVEKSGHELVLDDPALLHDLFWVGSYSLGYVRDVVKDKGIDVGLGGMLTLNSNPPALTPYYGGVTHGGWQLFMRFRPSRMKH